MQIYNLRDHTKKKIKTWQSYSISSSQRTRPHDISSNRIPHGFTVGTSDEVYIEILDFKESSLFVKIFKKGKDVFDSNGNQNIPDQKFQIFPPTEYKNGKWILSNKVTYTIKFIVNSGRIKTDQNSNVVIDDNENPVFGKGKSKLKNKSLFIIGVKMKFCNKRQTNKHFAVLINGNYHVIYPSENNNFDWVDIPTERGSQVLLLLEKKTSGLPKKTIKFYNATTDAQRQPSEFDEYREINGDTTDIVVDYHKTDPNSNVVVEDDDPKDDELKK